MAEETWKGKGECGCCRKGERQLKVKICGQKMIMCLNLLITVLGYVTVY